MITERRMHVDMHRKKNLHLRFGQGNGLYVTDEEHYDSDRSVDRGFRRLEGNSSVSADQCVVPEGDFYRKHSRDLKR